MSELVIRRLDEPDETRRFDRHDSWVVGEEPYVSLHFLGADAYAGD